MSRKRFAHSRIPECTENQFPDAQSAWFWFMRCQKARLDGARFERGLNRDVRPCEPDDIYRVVKALFRSGRIRSVNLGVLHRFGVLDRPPDPRCNEELLAARHWQEALIQLTSILRDKGIVA